MDGARLGGLGAVWGERLAERMLGDAGFESIRIDWFPHDVPYRYFIMET